jgi:hypothetical protein
MQAAPDVDVIVLAHTGFEGARNFSTLWRGGLIGATVRVRLWRIPAADIPRDPEAQLLWLYDRWLDVDRWLHQWLDDAQAHDAQADDDGDSAERSGP